MSFQVFCIRYIVDLYPLIFPYVYDIHFLICIKDCRIICLSNEITAKLDSPRGPGEPDPKLGCEELHVEPLGVDGVRLVYVVLRSISAVAKSNTKCNQIKKECNSNSLRKKEKLFKGFLTNINQIFQKMNIQFLISSLNMQSNILMM